MRRKWLTWFTVLLICSAFITGTAYAVKSWDETVTSNNYAERVPARLMHGIVNVALGWTQLIIEPARTFGDAGTTIYMGMVNGVTKTLYYTGTGVFDILTFWVPNPDGQRIATKDSVFQTFNQDDKPHSAKKLAAPKGKSDAE